jgi:hypothetical protein
MYYQLQAPDRLSLEMAYWEAQIAGLDPNWVGGNVLDIGTGHIEKVSALISKHKLDILVETDYEPTGYRR